MTFQRKFFHLNFFLLAFTYFSLEIYFVFSVLQGELKESFGPISGELGPGLVSVLVSVLATLSHLMHVEIDFLCI